MAPKAQSSLNQLLELSPLQLKWLVVRMNCGSDAAACRVVADLGEGNISKGTLRHWKRSPSFKKLLDLVRAHKDEAFKALVSGTMAPFAFEALRSLLTGPTPYEKVQGLRAYMDITKGSGPQGNNIDEMMERLREPAEVRVLAVYKRGVDGGVVSTPAQLPSSTTLSSPSHSSSYDAIEGIYKEV